MPNFTKSLNKVNLENFNVKRSGNIGIPNKITMPGKRKAKKQVRTTGDQGCNESRLPAPRANC